LEFQKIPILDSNFPEPKLDFFKRNSAGISQNTRIPELEFRFGAGGIRIVGAEFPTKVVEAQNSRRLHPTSTSYVNKVV
jgi:hypothetical protein